MEHNFSNSFTHFVETTRSRVQEIHSSAEYQNLKHDLNAAGSKVNEAVRTDLKSASKNIGKIIKRIARNERFQRLLQL
jgi:hypothetical protein